MSDEGTSGTDRSTDQDLRQNPRWRLAAQRHYDPSGDVELTTAVIFAVAEARGVDPSDVKSPVLYDVVDIPAIEKGFFDREIKSESLQETGVVEFSYDELQVQIKHDGWIQIFEVAS